MKKFTSNLIAALFVAGFLFLASCSEEITPLAPDEVFEEVELGATRTTDGQEPDTTGGPRVN